ncbi:Cysteine-rich receptor-like protein kinase 2 [Forsythia ovata]|uniref:non-specific serine/threonine protein kinase n=1 Tax=Forsythia ovata TaxID=205694 RepID=A0ABD1NXF8_9LAMI
MKKPIPNPSVIIIILVALLLPDASLGEPRAQMVKIMCNNQREHNITLFVPNFVGVMENISAQMRTLGFGMAVVGSGPDANYGLAKCYGDLSLLDCVLCYAEARTILPQCFPGTEGRIFLDGCFMRAGNYSFLQEYTGPNDMAVCGNRTQKSSAFQDSARRAVVQAVSAAPNKNGYARAQVPVSGTNESVYVLTDCWRTLNASSCRACLQNASASILGCLPWSEDPSKGKALNWEKRFEIIIGTAEGLVYLHENTNTRIIHRDIKASNILLDSRLRAKIADFGLARSFQEDKSHISTAIAGTL